MRVAVPIVACWVMALAGAAAASPAAKPGPGEGSATFAVELTADGVPAWHLEAIERALVTDLPGPRLKVPTDANTSPELVIAGELGRDELRYRIEQPARPPITGKLALAGLDRAQLARAVRTIAHDAIDRRDAPPAAHHPARLPAPAPPIAALVLLGMVALVLAAPFVIRRARPRPATLVVIGVVVLVAVALAVAGDRVPDVSAVILVAGGLAWGTFAAVTLPVVFPPMPGLERVEHEALVRALAAWAVLMVQRLVLVAACYAPLAAALVVVYVVLDVPALAMLGVIAPLAALVARHALHTWVDLAARRLDGERVEGDATATNPWHVATIGYLRGYLRRASAPVDRDLLDRVLLLPGNGDELVLYGGGQTHPRVVIPRPWLELALAPYGRPHDYAAPRVSTLEWNEWNAGLVVPTEIGAKIATREQRQPREPDPIIETEHEPFGEPPTLAGYIEPDAFDKREHHRPEEDPLWLDWDPGDEPDGTDPSDKDFLFGALVEQLGRIQRHEDRAETLALAFGRGRVAKVVARLRGLVARRRALVDDVHAALHHAHHHRVQYLAWRHRPDDTTLTSRAYPPELERTARELLPRLPAHVASFYRPRTTGRRGRIASGVALAAGAVALAAAVLQAIDYHATYVERTRAEDRRDGEQE